MLKPVVSILAAACLVFATPLQAAAASQQNNYYDVLQSYDVHISAVKTRSIDSSHSEYILLYNDSEENINIADWSLEYKRAEGGDWVNKLLANQSSDASYDIEPKTYHTLVTNRYIDDNPGTSYDLRIRSGSAESGGHIRLLAPEDNEESNEWLLIDKVGWGNADSPLGEAAPFAERGSTLRRLFDESSGIINTYDNKHDFFVSDVTDPVGVYQESYDEVDDEPVENEDEASEEETTSDDPHEDQAGDDGTYEESDEPEHEPSDNEPDNSAIDTDADNEQAQSCEGVVFSELLPNPQGPRSEHPRDEHAFIELYNMTNEPVELHGCGLQTSSNSTQYWFDESDELSPHEYKAFYETETGVQLPVSPSGTVYLLSYEDESELEAVTYPASMPEAASWAWFGDDDWQKSYSITPDESNDLLELKPCPEEHQERNPETNRCRNVETDSSSESYKPCGEGRERSPETNRCRLIDQGRDLVPCAPHQERNPETNRCRNIATAGPELVPCEPHQERNPETNRCRNINSSSRDLVPCAPHQERNPETNRCRNIESTSRDLVPCEPHQERNPETNRCRNVAAPNSEVMGVEDIKVATTSDASNWLLSGGIAGFALFYGVWEWRQDISRAFRALKRKL